MFAVVAVADGLTEIVKNRRGRQVILPARREAVHTAQFVEQ